MTAALVAGAVGAGAPVYDTAPPYAVGHELTLDDSGAVMQPVHTAASVQMVAARPGPVGTANQEVWAFGPAESPDVRLGGGHAMFQHHTTAGWTTSGPPVLDSSDVPFDADRVVSMSIAPSGEGWAVLRFPIGAGTADNDVFVHHVPGAPGPAWRLDRPSSDALNQLETANSTYTVDISLGSDPAGTYHGFAVISDAAQSYTKSASEFMKLDPTNGHWVVDASDGTNSQGQPATPQGQPAGWVDAVAVDPTSGDAWAVGSAFAVDESACTTGAVSTTPGAPNGYPTCLQKATAVLTQQPGSVIYHHESNGWAAVAPSSLASSASPSSLQYVTGGSAAGVAVDGHGGAWIAGDTGSTAPVRGQVQPATTSTPFVVHVGADKQAQGIYCAVGCQGSLPLTDGTLTELATAPPSGGDGGDVFLAGPAPTVLYRLRVPGDSSVGRFKQEPLTVGDVGSMAMFSGTEGWVGLDSAGASVPLVGHLTRAPDHPGTRRWPTPTGGQLAAVAEDPSGSGVAMAVGPAGVWRLEPATGLWSAMALPAGSDMPRSISWPTHNFAVAAGGRTILQFDGTSWRRPAVDGAIGGDLSSVAAMASPLAAPSAPISVGAATTPTPATVTDRLVGWGGNDQGQLGLGTTTNAYSPTAAPLPGPILSLSAGGTFDQAHTLAIACPCDQSHVPPTGSLYAWGSNASGQLGSALSTRQSLVPTLLGLPDTFVAVAAGGAHSLALDADGTVWAWGADSNGQLGDGAAPGAAPQPVPRQVMLPGGQPLQAVAISASGSMSLAIDTSGNVWQWGSTGAASNAESPVPTQMPGLTKATQIAAGGDFGIALAACPAGDAQSPAICNGHGDELFGWGNITKGEYTTSCSKAGTQANPTWFCPPQPLIFQQDAGGNPLDVTAIAAGPVGIAGTAPLDYTTTTLAVAEGKVWDVSGYDAPLAVTQQANPAYRGPAHALPGLSNVTSAAVGSNTSVSQYNFTLIGEQDGSLWGLGLNRQGELGTDPQALKSSPDTPVRVPGLVTHGPVTAGFDQSLAFADSAAGSSGQSSGPGSPGSGPGGISAPGAQAWAVGAGGTTVRFDGRHWSVEPSPVQNTLSAVAATGRDFVASGNDGLILVDTGQGWNRVPTPANLGWNPPGQSAVVYPNLDAAAGLPDGTVLIGGEYSTLLRRDPGDPPTSFHLVSPRANGTVRAIAMRRDAGGTLRMLISLGPFGIGGWLMAGDGSTWRDLDLSHVLILDAGTIRTRDQPLDELPVQRDPAQGVVLDPSGTSGWAVGDNGSAWRVALDGSRPASSPMSASAAVATDASAIGSFAFMANTGCVQGTCADAVGWGTRGDVVSLESLRAVDDAARAGSLGLLMAGGDLRRSGDNSLGEMTGLFDSLSIPTYAAMGVKDLNSATANTCAGGAANDNVNWRNVFKDRPAPWGTGTAGPPWSITPVGKTGAPSCGGANTHYAFDWHAGAGTIRFVVLDTSGGAAGDASAAEQSPQESEITWLSGLIGRGNPPTVLVMNQPVLPTCGGNDTALSGLLQTAGFNVVGILASAQPANWHCSVSVAGNRVVPMYMFGGGGGRFENSANASPSTKIHDASHGDYFSWQAISVMPDGRLAVQSMPVLESVAFGAPQGTVATRGNPIQFTGLGRIPDVGRVNFDAAPYSADTPMHISFPFSAASEVANNVVRPAYAFTSDDNSIIAPVAVDSAHADRPYIDKTGHTRWDSQSGLFCAFKPGTATIHLTAGTVTARLPVTVRVGSVSGTQCGPLAKLPPPPPVVPVKPAVQQPVPQQPVAAGPAPIAAVPHHFARPNPQLQVGAVVPPPAEVVPAPPGGMGQGAGQKEREEESEAATEDANMRALDPSGRGGGPDWLPLGAAMLGAGLAGFAIAAGRRRRGGASRAAVVTLGGWPPGGGRR